MSRQVREVVPGFERIGVDGQVGIKALFDVCHERGYRWPSMILVDGAYYEIRATRDRTVAEMAEFQAEEEAGDG